MAFKKNEILMYATTRMTLENMPSESSPSNGHVMYKFYIYKRARIGKSIDGKETEVREELEEMGNDS